MVSAHSLTADYLKETVLETGTKITTYFIFIQ